MSKCSTENKKVYVGFDVSEKTLIFLPSPS